MDPFFRNGDKLKDRFHIELILGLISSCPLKPVFEGNSLYIPFPLSKGEPGSL